MSTSASATPAACAATRREAVTRAALRQLGRGATMMLPTEDSLWVGDELSRRFGLPYWTLTTSATDANRGAIRIARMITGRNKVLVFSGCYHGGVEEAHVEIRDGKIGLRNMIHPNGVDHAPSRGSSSSTISPASRRRSRPATSPAC